MAEGKERYTEYKTDKADGSVNWAQEGKDAMKDWKPQVSKASLPSGLIISMPAAFSDGTLIRREPDDALSAPCNFQLYVDLVHLCCRVVLHLSSHHHSKLAKYALALPVLK